jgi:hypothetical protein
MPILLDVVDFIMLSNAPRGVDRAGQRPRQVTFAVEWP